MQIIIAILALSFLIIIHELGHFTVAKLSGIKVHEFALFMGPKLFSIVKGDTTYTLRLVPIGGYVRMEGEEQASEDSRAFNRKPILVRMAVIVAGPLMNLVVAVVIMLIIFSMKGYYTTNVESVTKGSSAYEAGMRSNDELISIDNNRIYNIFDYSLFTQGASANPVEIRFYHNNDLVTKVIKPTVYPKQKAYKLGFAPQEQTGVNSNIVTNVSAGSPASQAGLKVNDRIIRLNDKDIKIKQDIADYLSISKNNIVKITVLRNDREVQLKDVKPYIVETPQYSSLGIEGFQIKHGNIIATAKQSIVYSYAIARMVLYSVKYLIQGKISLKEVMGPVGIVTTIGDVVQNSETISDKIINLFNFVALLSINLGIFNLIPFPALDGSKIVILGVEGIRRKALPPEKEAIISLVGLTFLVGLMLFATYNDVIRRFFGG